METALSIICDFVIIVFNCGLYISLTPLKKDNILYKSLMYGTCILATIAYFIVAYVYNVPYSSASSICLSIPTFIVFFILCKYKNSRFFVTFCFVDSVTFALAVFAKIALFKGKVVGGAISAIILIILCTFVFFKARPSFKKYRDLMENVEKGWGPMAISGVFIYTILIASAALPTPLKDRLEYSGIYALLCVTVLTFYVVFIILIKEKEKIIIANIKLKEQQHWYHLAYIDELTQLSNKAAYDAKVIELENSENQDKDCFILMTDIDKFKQCNDTYGHLFGNEVLKKAAEFFKDNFDSKEFTFYRVGGDEFACITTNINEAKVKEAVNKINSRKPDDKVNCTLSCGYSKVDFNKHNAFEVAFFEADREMYLQKGNRK